MSTFDNKYRKLRGLKKRANYKKPQKMCDAIIQNKDYGEQSSKPDVSDDVLNLMKETFLSTLKKSEEERTRTERQTILQSESSEWLELRRSLLTASNFGKVIKMKPDTSCANIVKQLLYKINIEAVPLQHGREYEKKALQQLSTQEAVDIRHCGLYIDPEIPYLGATPDGIIDEETIVEVKCPITAFKTGLEEAITKKIVNFWIKDKSGNLEINKNHNWYYQVQEQLHVTRKSKCVFAVWFSESQPLKTEIIYRDDDYFENKMKPKLCNFYLNCILPEILDPRHTRNMEIRNPTYIMEAIKKKEEKKKLEISKRKIQRIIPIAEQEENTTLSLYQESIRSSTPVIPEAE
ncbi:unnamed protein product [Arctia plantaginis]|uniref:YqaJ viral recombinase domain-containing protein n=1 Tax=Arctia plantaginis TaxID=874455 RepID=A0A8S1B1I9_ARCPL|nr:unnamed protein product [Arctia plantaginis]